LIEKKPIRPDASATTPTVVATMPTVTGGAKATGYPLTFRN